MASFNNPKIPAWITDVKDNTTKTPVKFSFKT